MIKIIFAIFLIKNIIFSSECNEPQKQKISFIEENRIKNIKNISLLTWFVAGGSLFLLSNNHDKNNKSKSGLFGLVSGLITYYLASRFVIPNFLHIELDEENNWEIENGTEETVRKLCIDECFQRSFEKSEIDGGFKNSLFNLYDEKGYKAFLEFDDPKENELEDYSYEATDNNPLNKMNVLFSSTIDNMNIIATPALFSLVYFIIKHFKLDEKNETFYDCFAGNNESSPGDGDKRGIFSIRYHIPFKIRSNPSGYNLDIEKQLYDSIKKAFKNGFSRYVTCIFHSDKNYGSGHFYVLWIEKSGNMGFYNCTGFNSKAKMVKTEETYKTLEYIRSKLGEDFKNYHLVKSSNLGTVTLDMDCSPWALIFCLIFAAGGHNLVKYIITDLYTTRRKLDNVFSLINYIIESKNKLKENSKLIPTGTDFFYTVLSKENRNNFKQNYGKVLLVSFRKLVYDFAKNIFSEYLFKK